MYYINVFFLYSILGHIMESIVYLFFKGHSGILFFPWTPIYGLGVVIVIFCYHLLENHVKNRKLQYFYVFLTGFLLLSMLEWLGGVLIEKLFGYVFWNYDDLKMNIGHYISLEISFIWGMASILVIKLLPITDKIVKKIPRLISWLLILLMILDIILTISVK